MSEKLAVVDPRIYVDGMEIGEFLLDQFSFYDKEGHMVALDAKLIGKSNLKGN